MTRHVKTYTYNKDGDVIKTEEYDIEYCADGPPEKLGDPFPDEKDIKHKDLMNKLKEIQSKLEEVKAPTYYPSPYYPYWSIYPYYWPSQTTTSTPIPPGTVTW